MYWEAYDHVQILNTNITNCNKEMAKTRKHKALKTRLYTTQMFDIPGMDIIITMINLWKKIGGRWRISPDKSSLKTKWTFQKDGKKNEI